MTAWYLSRQHLPPRAMAILGTVVLIAVPSALIANQPDLGTSLLVAASGLLSCFWRG